MSGCGCKSNGGGIHANGDPYGDLRRLGLPPDEATNGFWCWDHSKDYEQKRIAADAKIDGVFVERGLCGFLEAWIGRCTEKAMQQAYGPEVLEVRRARYQ